MKVLATLDTDLYRDVNYHHINNSSAIIFLVFSFLDRMHVIDSLPLLWMLDGRLITCKS